MGSNRNVLICEDDELLLESFSDIIETLGLVPIKCVNGFDAIKKIEELNPALIVSDINMPVLGGLELLEYCNSKKLSTPLLFLTAQSDLSTYRQGLSRGHFDFLPKPVSADNLIKSIQSALTFGKVEAPDSHFRALLKRAL